MYYGFCVCTAVRMSIAYKLYIANELYCRFLAILICSGLLSNMQWFIKFPFQLKPLTQKIYFFCFLYGKSINLIYIFLDLKEYSMPFAKTAMYKFKKKLSSFFLSKYKIKFG